MRKSQTTMTDDDRTEMAQATKDAWAKTEAAMADRTPQFGYRPVEEIAKDIAKTWSVPEVSDIEIWKGRALRAEHIEDVLTKEIGRLRSIVRVNLLRHVPSATHEAIDALLDGTAENV